jgi:hypothetical protein
MSEIKIMQLLIIVLILLCGGNRQRLGEMKPYLCDLGVQPNDVDKAEKALSEAEEVEGVISVVKSMTGGGKNDLSSIFSAFMDGADENEDEGLNEDVENVDEENDGMDGSGGDCDKRGNRGCFPLEPIINIANDEIISSLCRCLCL